MWDLVVFLLRVGLGHILRLGCLTVQERHKDADLQHVHELLIKGLLQDAFKAAALVKNFPFVLGDQE